MDENEMKKATGKRIRKLRKEKGWTMKEFGEKLDPIASDSIVSRWERGISIPNKERLEQIAKIGEMSVKFLTTGVADFEDLSYHSDDAGYRFAKEMQKHRTKIEKDNNELISNLNRFADNVYNMDFIEKLYLENALRFFDNSNADDVKKMAAFLGQLNKYNDVKNASNSKELYELINQDTEYIREFLIRRYGYEGD